MMGGSRTWTRLAMALALLAGVAPGVLAQTNGSSDEDPYALEAKADEYSEDNSKWTRAADLYRQAAALRDASDAQAVENLIKAASLEFYRGHEGTAIRDLKNAAQRALAIGDVVVAANAFADAAWVASKDGRALQAQELAERAELLTKSPLISQSDRVALAERLQPNR